MGGSSSTHVFSTVRKLHAIISRIEKEVSFEIRRDITLVLSLRYDIFVFFFPENNTFSGVLKLRSLAKCGK